MTSSETTKQTQTENYEEEFEAYLKNQCLRTTFNGLEIESFSWYKKMIGVK